MDDYGYPQDMKCGAAKEVADSYLLRARKTKDAAMTKLLAAFNPKTATYDLDQLVPALQLWQEGEGLAKIGRKHYSA